MPLDNKARQRAAQTKVERTKARVIDSTRELMREQGAFRVEFKDIVEASGVSAPTIYRLFGSKSHLMEEAAAGQPLAALLFPKRPADAFDRHMAKHVGRVHVRG